MCRFSIIIPVFNEEKCIKKCLNSITEQTLEKEKYEIIVIDDGSSDKSIEISQQYNVNLLKTNRLGAGGARNKGLEKAKGEYIILLDGDDYFYKKDVLKNLDEEINDQDIVFVKYKEILENRERIIEENPLNTLSEQIYKSDNFCCTLKCFKRKLVDNIKYKNNCFHEDISFKLELMCKAESLLYFNEILYVYYKEQNASTIDHYSVRKALDFFTQTLEFLNFADKYQNKKDSILKRIENEHYFNKLAKLENWVKNDKAYNYKSFLDNKN